MAQIDVEMMKKGKMPGINLKDLPKKRSQKKTTTKKTKK